RSEPAHLQHRPKSRKDVARLARDAVAGTVHHQPSDRGEAAEALAERAHRIEGDVDAAASGDALHLFLEVDLPIVDGVREPELAQTLVLAGRSGADGGRAELPADLHGRGPHASRRRVDEHDMSAPQMAQL